MSPDEKKAYMREYNKMYLEKNREALKEQQRLKHQRRIADGSHAAYMERTKEARQETAKAEYQKNAEKHRETAKQWRAQNRDKHLQDLKTWRENNRARVKGYNTTYMPAYRLENRDRLLALGRKYRELNGDKVRACKIAWYEQNKQHVLEKNKRWFKANPDAVIRMTHTRRARVIGNGGVLSAGIVRRLFKKQDGLCACCGKALVRYHLDHIMPLALGGTNTDDNVQLLLPRCNLKKGSLHPNEVARLKRSGSWLI